MNISRSRRVVVATSGSSASESAIAYAADQALVRGLPLEIVHVVTPTIAVGPCAVSPEIAVRQAGKELLAAGEQVALRIASQVEVTTRLLTGSRADTIVHDATGADLLVVGEPPHELLERVWAGSTVMGIAARATCPVAVVRPNGVPEPPKRQILVGLKSTRHAEHLLASAFAVARQTQSELRIVHAWHLLSQYDEAIAERLPTPEWETEEGRSIDAMLIDLRMAYPDVRVRVDLVHGQPGPVLVEACRDADLVLISRPIHGGFAHHVGAAARTVLREAACTVLVVPPVDVPSEVEHLRTEPVMAP